MEQFQRPGSAQPLDSDLFFPADQPPPLPLFISHRWESRDHPDPHGHQLRAIQSLLRSIREVVACRRITPAERIRKVPSLRIHGVFQAALIVGASDDSQDEDNPWRDWHPVIQTKTDVDVLQHVGIWYDFVCMPRDQSESGAGDTAVRQSLSQLPDLVRSCPLLVLRSKNDGYSDRGWCAAELAAARRDRSILLLRMDLLGSPIHSSDVELQSDDPAADFELRFIRSALEDWESQSVTAPHLRGLFIGLPGLKPAEEGRPDPLLTTGRNPDAFPQQQALLLYFIQTLGALSRADAHSGGLREPFDLARTMLDAMQKVRLHCTEERDIVFVGLSILRSRHHPKLVPTVEGFYREATVRWLRGESIKLIRFRERRPDPMKWEVSYLFEGETPGGRPTPTWAR